MRDRSETILLVLGWTAAALYVAVAVIEFIVVDDRLTGGHLAFTFALIALAAGVLIGIRLVPAQPVLGVTMASLAALVGGFMLFWTGLAILLAIGIVVFSVLAARTRTAPA